VWPAVLLSATLGLTTAHADSTVYKWVDESGAVHYTDRPPPPGGKLLGVENNMVSHNGAGLVDGNTTAAPQSSPQNTAPRSAAPAATRPVPAKTASPELKRQVEEDVAAAQADACQVAKERYDRYIHSRRLYREGMDKTQTFLSDAEIDAARLNARAEMEEACTPR
jgi:hypothetical protein